MKEAQHWSGKVWTQRYVTYQIYAFCYQSHLSLQDKELPQSGGRKRRRSRSLTPTNDGSTSPRNVVDMGEKTAESCGRGGRGRRRGKPGKPGKPQVCKRASGSRWLSSNTIANAHGIPPQVGEALSNIITSAELSLASKEGKTIVDTLSSLLSGKPWLREMDAFRIDSLDAIAARCQRTEEMELGLNFISMINMIQFVAKIER